MISNIIDISHANGQFDWTKLSSIRMVFCKATQGTRFIDPLFEWNREHAERHGIMLVPYHFIDLSDGHLQAAHFIDTIGLLHGEPAMLDWERVPPTNQRASATVLKAVFDAVKVSAGGRSPLVYRGELDPAPGWLLKEPAFIARYRARPPQSKWLFWQNSKIFRIPGIPGEFDHDYFNGTEAQLEEWFNGTSHTTLVA